MKKSVITGWLIVLFSCTKEVDVAYPSAISQTVLNGILHPDSIITISLTRTIPLRDTLHFPTVSNATVSIFEENENIGVMTFRDSLYVLEYFPVVGKRYTVEASIPNYGLVKASDMVPPRPAAEACFYQDTAGRYRSTDVYFEITIQDFSPHAHWLDILDIGYDYQQCDVLEDTLICEGGVPEFSGIKEQYYQSFSTLPDPFNSFINTISGGIREYDGYVRIGSDVLEGQLVSLEIAPPISYDRLLEYRTLHERLIYSLNIISTSTAYDRYLKSSMIYYLNNEFGGDDAQPNPFAEPTRIYSNVENGLGIFAAYNSVSIPVEDFPCE